MNPNYSEFISNALAQASQIAKANFGKVAATTKPEDNNQVLTSTDIEIGNLLVSKVKELFPDHNIIDEEAGVIDNGSDKTWVIDPIDGTSNFANGIESYGIMIGLLEKDIPVAGGIALPSFNKILTAEKNKGAFLGGRKLTVTKETRLLSSLIAYGIDGHQENPALTRKEAKQLGEIILAVRNLRTSNSAYDAVMVAEGRYGAILNKTSKIWDNVAQQIIIEEAGGLYTDFEGRPIDYSDAINKIGNNFTMCAGAPSLHKQLQKIISQPAS
jgi:myo-inositol-1(or 4)-monophosphatase